MSSIHNSHSGVTCRKLPLIVIFLYTDTQPPSPPFSLVIFNQLINNPTNCSTILLNLSHNTEDEPCVPLVKKPGSYMIFTDSIAHDK